MVSLINIFLNIFRKNQIIQIHRLPPTKILRAHQLGLTLALIFSILAIVLNFKPLFSFPHLPWYTSLLLVLVIALGTYWGGPFVIIIGLYTLITYLVQKFWGCNPTGTWAALYLMAKWYLGGYAFGAIFAILYNDLVSLFINIFDQKRVKIVFAYDPKEKINIIKSPISEEEAALNKLFEEHPKLKERRLYQYNIQEPVGKNPYTIAFVANPKVLKKRVPDEQTGEVPDYETHRLNSKNYYFDPIINNRDLFLRNVERAMSSFEHNEVLGRPEIWSRIRIVTIFDEAVPDTDEYIAACLEEYQDEFVIADRVIDNLIDPMEQMEKVVEDMLNNNNQSHIPDPITIKDIDVIYALSAAPNHDRSTAHYSAYLETGEIYPDTTLTGEPFTFDPDPNSEHPKLSEICVHKCTPCTPCGDIPANTRFICQHEHYTEHPGRVALNVIGARNKTFVHEFAHAMSSVFRGIITEEYADQAIIRKLDKPGVAPQQFTCNEATKAPFYINRIEKNQELNKLIPVHEVFAKYNGVTYLSDLAHPSAEEDWIGYFPERYCRIFGCIMDRTIGHYEFDRLLSAFMYDRLIVKINRPDRT